MVRILIQLLATSHLKTRCHCLGYNQVGLKFLPLYQIYQFNTIFSTTRGCFLWSTCVRRLMPPSRPLGCLLSGKIHVNNRMHSFDQRMGDAVSNTGKKGWLVSILELGAWFGVLVTGAPTFFHHDHLQYNSDGLMTQAISLTNYRESTPLSWVN